MRAYGGPILEGSCAYNILYYTYGKKMEIEEGAECFFAQSAKLAKAGPIWDPDKDNYIIDIHFKDFLFFPAFAYILSIIW